jgi:hypothetical protein
MLWSICGTIHLQNDDGRDDPPWRAGYGRTPGTSFGRFRRKVRHFRRPGPREAGNPKVAVLRDGHFACTLCFEGALARSFSIQRQEGWLRLLGAAQARRRFEFRATESDQL